MFLRRVSVAIAVTFDTFIAGGCKASFTYAHKCTLTDLEAHVQVHTTSKWLLLKLELILVHSIKLILVNSNGFLWTQSDSCELKRMLMNSNWFLRTRTDSYDLKLILVNSNGLLWAQTNSCERKTSLKTNLRYSVSCAEWVRVCLEQMLQCVHLVA